MIPLIAKNEKMPQLELYIELAVIIEVVWYAVAAIMFCNLMMPKANSPARSQTNHSSATNKKTDN